MQRKYHDALAIVREYGRPEFFVTFTANLAWPEISQNLPMGEHAVNRPDRVARVLNLTLKALLQVLTHKSVLGEVVAYCWTIEFQKRGLRHAHILLVVHLDCKPGSPADVDRVVSAELPDDSDPRQADFFEIV